MKQNSIPALRSKLAVYKVCYHEAERTNDLKRIVLLDSIISDLRHEIKTFEE